MTQSRTVPWSIKMRSRTSMMNKVWKKERYSNRLSDQIKD